MLAPIHRVVAPEANQWTTALPCATDKQATVRVLVRGADAADALVDLAIARDAKPIDEEIIVRGAPVLAGSLVELLAQVVVPPGLCLVFRADAAGVGVTVSGGALPAARVEACACGC